MPIINNIQIHVTKVFKNSINFVLKQPIVPRNFDGFTSQVRVTLALSWMKPLTDLTPL